MDQIKLKLTHARKLIKELQTEVGTYFKGEPYKVNVKRDVDTRRLIYYVEEVKEIPPRIQLITGDIIQNLRSALDHLAYRLFIIAGGDGDDARHIYFPIAKDEKSFHSTETQRKIRGLTQIATDAICAARPYKEGNEILWQLHELNNIDKHRLLITAGSSFGSMDISAHMREGFKEMFDKTGVVLPSLFIEPTDKNFLLKVGDELFIDEPDAKPNSKISFNFQLLISEPSIIDEKRLMDTMRKMADEVEITIGRFKKLV